ncbi:NAD(P)H-hydrate epimerase [Candidatus Pacearchaeota archaeon]|nr:NAD(P)H-hydrate epimerase [Candidatus Pacearchaeota archaeon]
MEYVSAEQMSDVDDIAINKYGIDIYQLMENAGRNLARLVASLNPKKVSILYGKGNNGADGLVAARHLLIYGIDVEIIPASEDNGETVIHELNILKHLGIRPKQRVDLNSDLIIDGLLGYNIRGDPKGRFAELIEAANDCRRRGVTIVSIDIPSGMDPDSGSKHNPCIYADYVLTLALPKKGLRYMENVYLANISIPKQVYSELGINIEDYFKYEDIIQIC